jgi:hypothetical protein
VYPGHFLPSQGRIGVTHTLSSWLLCRWGFSPSTLVRLGSVSPSSLTHSKISACTKGILDPVDLQRNYTYIIEK